MMRTCVVGSSPHVLVPVPEHSPTHPPPRCAVGRLWACSVWPHVAAGHVTCGHSQWRRAVSVRNTPDFEDLVWKENIKHLRDIF